MSIDAISSAPPPAPPSDGGGGSGAPPAGGSAPTFAAVLQAELARGRSGVAEVRAEIAAIRGGGQPGAFRAGVPVVRSPDSSPHITSSDPGGAGGAPVERMSLSAYLATQTQTGDTRDPYGWRAMTRHYGDTLVAPGFGTLFERQIQQESGFNPEVVFGLRVSSAGAEGIAQLMPQYYSHVDRRDPQASLVASANTMKHYLAAWDGDLRRALASYNAGLGRVRQLVDAHGEGWERALPAETRQYLAAILGPAAPQVSAGEEREVAVFGGRGPHGVLTMPLEAVAGDRLHGTTLELFAAAGSPVRAPADGHVRAFEAGSEFGRLVIDHGNGWLTTLDGVAAAAVRPGDLVRRGDALGTLGTAGGSGRLALEVSLDGRALDPRRYLLS